MKETDRTAKLFEDLYNGHPWLDVMILPTLQQLTARQAARRIYKNWNTIWEITHHLICWRENVLQRIQGNIIRTPSHNYIVPVVDASPAAWKETLRRLEESQVAWVKFLTGMKASALEDRYPPNQMTYFEHIQGILQHDAYHLGQIVLLAKRV